MLLQNARVALLANALAALTREQLKILLVDAVKGNDRKQRLPPVTTKLGSGKQNALASHKGKLVVMNAVTSIVKMISVRGMWCILGRDEHKK